MSVVERETIRRDTVNHTNMVHLAVECNDCSSSFPPAVLCGASIQGIRQPHGTANCVVCVEMSHGHRCPGCGVRLV